MPSIEKVGLLEERPPSRSITPRQPGFKIDIWTDKKEYMIGDSLTIYVRSDMDCYVNILDIGTSGNPTLIFPNSLHKANFIKGGTTYSIPGDFFGFTIEVLGPTGVERIQAIATLEPFDLLYPLDTGSSTGSTRIKLSMKKLSNILWAQDDTEINIYTRGEELLKNSRGIQKEETDEPQMPIDIIGTTGVREEKEDMEDGHRIKIIDEKRK
ncbi:MAG: DUF4384 domain-containing protein [bacterium]